MTHHQRQHLFFAAWTTILLLVLLDVGSLAQESGGVRLSRADDPVRRRSQYELEDVRFVGCDQTTPEQLLGIISSRASELSLTRRIARYYSTNLARIPATPAPITARLARVEKELRNELRYFDPRVAEDDSAALVAYLTQNGFHQGSVGWTFGLDTATRKNVLTFIINEGPRAVVDGIYYYGLDQLPSDVALSVASAQRIRPGDPYSDGDLELEIRRILTTLRNSGYYKADTVRVAVGLSGDRLHDTIAALFSTGHRYRISAVLLEESTNGYPSVDAATRRRQLEVRRGDWYSAENIARSRTNLLLLGTFESVTIDTVHRDSLPSLIASNAMDSSALRGMPLLSDSTIALRVFTKNLKPYDVGLDFLLYQTSIDNYVNFGIGGSALYRNLFGGAQASSLTAQFILQDISRLFQQSQLETETLVQYGFVWPNAFRIGSQRASLNVNAFYSLRRLVNPFLLESGGITIRMPINLFTHTYFNGLEASLGLERQVPRDYEGALQQALDAADTPEEAANVVQTFLQFIALDRYLANEGGLLTGVYVGGTLRGDHRDNPVNPSRGTFTSLSSELGYGAGKFWRSQFFNATYGEVSPRLVVATKVKVGHIALLDRNNAYVPLERQFFAGGAASIRSFASRQLHDPVSGRLDSTEGLDERLTSNILGSASLLELGLELRYTFSRPLGWPELWASIVASSGITVFLDAGNAFNRLTVDKASSVRFEDLYNGSVVALGVGYRYDTPVGPFRIDYATSVYDPLRSTGAFIASGRQNVMGFTNWQLSIGLGHAF